MNTNISSLINQYYQIQEHRVAFGNQIFALKKAELPVEPYDDYQKRLHNIEKDIVKYLKKELKDHVMWDWFEGVKGIGPILAASLIAHIEIEKAQHASSVWKICGMAVGEDGRADRRVKGQKLAYNPFLKKTCFLIGESFIKSKGKYRQIYDTSKEFYKRKFPKEVKEKNRTLYTKMHIHRMSSRRAVKMFLSDMYAEWRTREGLEVSEPFTHKK